MLVRYMYMYVTITFDIVNSCKIKEVIIQHVLLRFKFKIIEGVKEFLKNYKFFVHFSWSLTHTEHVRVFIYCFLDIYRKTCFKYDNLLPIMPKCKYTEI